MEKKLRKPSITQSAYKAETASIDNQRGRVRIKTKHKLEPKNPFKPAQVYKILQDMVTQEVNQFYYNAQDSPKLCQDLAAQIRAKVKALNYDRCKIICVVEIVQKNLQSIRSICSFLWDPERDNYTVFNYNKFDLLATAYVFGMYYD